MARRRLVSKRRVDPDAKFGSIVVAKLVNKMMKSGKKSKSQSIVYKSMEKVSEWMKGDSLELLEKALENIKPVVEVRSRRVGGATYQVPVEVRPARAMALAMRWLIEAASKRSEKGMIERLARELRDAIEGKGAAIKIKQDKEKMAEANKAFASFKWT